MSVHRIVRADGRSCGGCAGARAGAGRGNVAAFDRKADALAFDDELRRRRRLGELVGVVGSQETLDHYVAETWAKTHAVTLAPKHGEDVRGPLRPARLAVPRRLKLAELTPEVIARWQAERIAAGAGRLDPQDADAARRHPAAGRRVGPDHSQPGAARAQGRPAGEKEVRPLAPATVEAMRAAAGARRSADLSPGVLRAAAAGGARAALG